MRRAILLLSWLTVTAFGQTCVQTLSPTFRDLPAATGQLFQGNFNVTSNLSTCTWASTSNNSWIAVQVGQTGRGNGIVGYSVDNNLTPVARTGTITVGNATFTVNQAAATCNATLTLQGGSALGAEGGTRQLQLTTSCEWTVTSSQPWVTIAPATGRGNSAISLTIAANNTATPRSAIISALGQNISLTQAAGTCSFALTPTQQTVPAAGGAYSAGLVTACAWSATSNVSWLTLNPPTAGNGNGSLTYTVAANTNSADARTGLITVGNSTLTVQQAGGACNVTLNPTSANIASAGGTGTFAVSTPCSFTARSNVAWITATAGANSVTYSVATNTSVQARTGTITAAGATFTITQAGSSCSYTVSPDSLDIPPAGVTTASITVTTTSGCDWTASSDVPWLRIIGQITGGAQGSVQYTVDPNSAGSARSGTLTVAGRAIPVRQNSGTAPRFSAAGLVHSASYQPGGVSPGEIITLYGEGLGPDTLTTLTLNGQLVSSTLAGTRLLFDGTPAPLVYTSRTQVSAIVPYGVANKTTVPVIAEYLGAQSTPVNVRVLPALPALYAADASGSGPGAILNQDGTLNTRLNPARPGQVVILYGTGEGLTSPLQADGQVTPGAEPLPRPVRPVTVTLGGVLCPILYAGAPPGLVAGALQINIQLPANVPTGDAVPIVLSVGEALSPDTVTLAIRP